MKLSYTIRNWPQQDWAGFCTAAVDAKLQGLEMDSVRNPALTSRTSPTNPELAVAARRPLMGQNLTIPCVGVEADLTSPAAEDEVSAAVETARNLLVSYVLLHTDSGSSEEIIQRLQSFVDIAERAGVVLLLESSGPMGDTKKLVEVLDYFACDHLSACLTPACSRTRPRSRPSPIWGPMSATCASTMARRKTAMFPRS